MASLVTTPRSNGFEFSTRPSASAIQGNRVQAVARNLHAMTNELKMQSCGIGIKQEGIVLHTRLSHCLDF